MPEMSQLLDMKWQFCVEESVGVVSYCSWPIFPAGNSPHCPARKSSLFGHLRNLLYSPSAIQAAPYGIILFCRVFVKEWLQERNGHLQRI